MKQLVIGSNTVQWFLELQIWCG